MENKQELEQIKNIINTIINLVEKKIKCLQKGENTNEDQELLDFLIGNKENVITIITKISNLLLKLGLLDIKDNKEIFDSNFIEKFLSKK